MEAWVDVRKKMTKALNHARPDVFYALAPIDFVCRVCGLLPVKLTRNKLGYKYHGRTNYPLLVYGVTLALVLIAVQCWGVYRDVHVEWQSTRSSARMMFVVMGSDTGVVVIISGLAILGSSSRWKRVLRALNYIDQADEKLDFTATKNLRGSSIILITCTFVSMIFLSILNHMLWEVPDNAEGKGPWNYFPLYIMYGVVAAMEMQYAIILMNLGARFTKLNSTIKEITKINATIDYKREQSLVSTGPRSQRLFDKIDKSSIEGSINENRMTESIDQLMKVYELLCDSILQLNEAFGVELLLCTLSCLVHLVITLYFFFAEFNGPSSRWYVFMRQIGWVLFHIYNTLLFAQPSHMVASKARNTGSLVSQALASNWSPRAKKQLERFTMQLLQRPVEFTCCGLFYLGRGLITSIAGAVTTYLAILVQFRSSSNSDAESLLQNASVLLKNVSKVRAS